MDENNSVDEQREQLAAAFGNDTDPLAGHAEIFQTIDIDPFGIFLSDVVQANNLSEATHRNYRTIFKHWHSFMEQEGRHPACPAVDHVKGFAQYLAEERENHPRTIKQKIWRLNKVYRYWQDDPAFPHPQDFNPFSLAASKLDLNGPETKEPPRIPLEKLQEKVRGVTHIQKRAVIALQLKLGLRAGEVCNIQLTDIQLQDSELKTHYSQLGAHGSLNDRENALYVPSRDERDGNKSRRPRILPLDDEVRDLLRQYLLIRPQTDVPWLFLSESYMNSPSREAINEFWKDAFLPEYAETDDHRAVTSHFGRHYFTTFWKIDQDLNQELVKYMRGDTVGNSSFDDRCSLDDYLHTYYEDIEPIYRKQIFTLVE
ncbi:tyrosine-type recombinase/integrase [Halosimplex marinum]|uniref:tyrosine-type recombinase/integrase n=1 Tax=Halosimplex marinum TaxID=3396620 RepID=UPI003F56CA02